MDLCLCNLTVGKPFYLTFFVVCQLTVDLCLCNLTGGKSIYLTFFVVCHWLWISACATWQQVGPCIQPPFLFATDHTYLPAQFHTMQVYLLVVLYCSCSLLIPCFLYYSWWVPLLHPQIFHHSPLTLCSFRMYVNAASFDCQQFLTSACCHPSITVCCPLSGLIQFHDHSPQNICISCVVEVPFHFIWENPVLPSFSGKYYGMDCS